MSRPLQENGKERWRKHTSKSSSGERHYCPVCQTWMGSDRASILLHEQGKQHREKLVQQQQERRQQQKKAEQQAQFLQASLQQMESAARQSLLQHDLPHYSVATQVTLGRPTTGQATGATPSVRSANSPLTLSSNDPSPAYSSQNKQEKKEWTDRKHKRQEENASKRRQKEEATHPDADPSEDPESDEQSRKKAKQIQIEPGQGHYEIPHLVDSQGRPITYLEGSVFGNLLEEDMPIQIWMGSSIITPAEQRLPDRQHDWRDGLVAALVRPTRDQAVSDDLLVDVAYLPSAQATEEILEKSVPLHRIRIRLGADDSIPDNLEEARLLAMGGEEVVLDTSHQAEPVDEHTGISAWSTVSIKRTTIRQELKEERERRRRERREAALEAERQKKLADARKMEEAKVANADDSALGAYDVWNRSKAGYKGVDIHDEARVALQDTAKKLADGSAPVSFKKSLKTKPKMNRRTTSADDD